MPYVKKGLAAKLKLDAYQQFHTGPITGAVSYIAERKENDKYYALVELKEQSPDTLRSGYSVHGEIIIQRHALIKYFIKKMFKSFDPS